MGMRILVTNDDGILAPGLAALAQALSALGHVDIVAPESGQSGAAHSITLLHPLMCERISVEGRPFGWSVDGSPADCVKLAVFELCSERPDLVVSGINAGANRGVDVFYSGTVAAAIEAAFIGIPSVAVSLASAGGFDFPRAAVIARRTIERALEVGLRPGTVLNINIPNLAEGEPRGVRVVPQSTGPWDDAYDRRTDPRGRPYYWLTGETDRSLNEDLGTDVGALRAGYVTITPLQYDLTHYAHMNFLRDAWGSATFDE